MADAPTPPPAAPGEEPGGTPVRTGADLLPLFKHLEHSAADAVSQPIPGYTKGGGIGVYQITAGTARQYGFDPTKLMDPKYNETAATTILDDLLHKYRGDTDAVMVGYNAGPSAANRWIASGRKTGLPLETMRYLNSGRKFIKINGIGPRDLTTQSPAMAVAAPNLPDAPQPPGLAELDKLRAAGFSEPELQQHKQDVTQKLLSAGFTPQEINRHYGEGDPNPTALDTLMQRNLSNLSPDAAMKVAQNPMDAFHAGWDMSVTGLAVNKAMPSHVLPEQATVGQRIMAGAGQLAGDLPFNFLGAVGGGAVGAESGPGALATAGAGAMMLPQSIRELQMDYYRRGEVKNLSDLMVMAGKSSWNVAKAGITGALMGPAGAKVEGALGSGIVGKLGNLGTQAATATTVGSILSGHVPDSGDFLAASVLMLGTYGGVKAGGMVNGRFQSSAEAQAVSENMAHIYKETGIPPWTLAAKAATDPVIRQEILAQDVSGKPVFPTLRLNGPPEPEPFTPRDPALDKAALDKAIEGGKPGNETTAEEMQKQKDTEQKQALEKYQATPEEKAAQDKAIEAKAAVGGGGAKEPPDGGTAESVDNPVGPRWKPDLNRDQLFEIAHEFIGEPPKDESTMNLDKMYRQFISELGPARGIDKMLIERKFDAKNQLGIEDMFRQTYASDSRAGYFVLKGGIDPITFEHQSGVPPVKAAVGMAKSAGNVRDWVDWMVAARAADKEAQGLKSGHPLDPVNLQRLVDLGRDDYQGATDSLQKTLDGGLMYGKDSGVFSHEQIVNMKTLNPTYISFRRIMGDDSTMPQPKAKGSRGFNVREPVRRFEGDDRQILDPLMATIDNLHQIVRMSDRNRAIGSVIALAEKHGVLDDLGLKRIAAPEVKATIAEPGSDTFKPYLPENASLEGFEPFLATRAMRGMFKANDNRFLYIRNGVPEVWVAKDPALAGLLRGADTPGEANVVLKIAQGVAAAQRAGIVTSPDFPTRVTIRHQNTAFIMDSTSPPPYLTWIRGAMSAFKQDDAFWSWVRRGGAASNLAEMDRDVLQRDLQNVMEETGTWDKMWNTVRHPLEAAQIISERIDQSARIGYDKNAISKGVEPIKAAMMGRKAMLDYAEKSTLQFMQWWTRTTPFLRPHILGLKQFGEAITENPGSVVLKSLASITAPVVMLHALNTLQDTYGGLPEDQKFKNLPRWQKDSMYILPQVGGVRLRIPFPYVVGPPLGGLTNRFMDDMFNDDPNAYHGWASMVTAEVLPMTIPALALPVIEHVSNHNFTTGRPMVADSLKEASGDMQYTENTTEPAKALSRVLQPLGVNVSPIILDNYVRDWTGSLGLAAMRAVGAPFVASSKPWEMADIPFVGSFLVRHPDTSVQPIEDFFDMKAEAQKAVADKGIALKHLREQNPAAADELQRALEDRQMKVDGIAHTLQQQHSLIRALNADEKMTTDEKRQFTDQIVENMINLSNGGIQMLKASKDAH